MIKNFLTWAPQPLFLSEETTVLFICFFKLARGQQLEKIAGVEYNYAFFQVLTVPKRNCIYVVGPKKRSEYCSHMLQVYEFSECSLVCVFCLVCTRLILRAVMASKLSVFNKQTWWTLSSCFTNWNSLVWTLTRVEIPLTVWCWTAAFQRRR